MLIVLIIIEKEMCVVILFVRLVNMWGNGYFYVLLVGI